MVGSKDGMAALMLSFGSMGLFTLTLVRWNATSARDPPPPPTACKFMNNQTLWPDCTLRAFRGQCLKSPNFYTDDEQHFSHGQRKCLVVAEVRAAPVPNVPYP
ncbi:hypothetical protein C8R43DRAFT_998103 [Mycena crocata]|nr:hypothetical protein C8R43DRAFT_998103 [Mycena crocata]